VLVSGVESVSLTGMKRGFFLFGIVLPMWLCSQTPHIDSLRIRLPFLKDSARIDCLNELCFQFFDQAIRDSAESYAASAYREAEVLRYFHGIARVLSHQGAMQTYFYSNFAGGEQLTVLGGAAIAGAAVKTPSPKSPPAIMVVRIIFVPFLCFPLP